MFERYMMSFIKSLALLVGILTCSACASSPPNSAQNLGIDRDGIRETFIRNQKPLQICYGIALKASSNVSGKMVLDFDIAEKGKPIRCTVSPDKSTLRNELLEKCLCRELLTWTFPIPPPAQTVQVFYPLAFSGK